MLPLEGRVLLVSGAMGGVGRAVVAAAAEAGADIAVIVRHSGVQASAECEQVTAAATLAGRRCLSFVADLRVEADLQRAVGNAYEAFGQLDMIVNMTEIACADSTLAASSEVFRLMIDVNLYGAYLLGRAALPHVLSSEHGQVLTVSPPVELAEEIMGQSLPWSISKYAATLLTLGWAAEFRDHRFSANTLWPHRPIREREGILLAPRRGAPVFLPTIMADAAVDLLSRPAGEVTGRSLLDAEVLRASGVTDFSGYEVRRSAIDPFRS